MSLLVSLSVTLILLTGSPASGRSPLICKYKDTVTQTELDSILKCLTDVAARKRATNEFKAIRYCEGLPFLTSTQLTDSCTTRETEDTNRATLVTCLEDNNFSGEEEMARFQLMVLSEFNKCAEQETETISSRDQYARSRFPITDFRVALPTSTLCNSALADDTVAASTVTCLNSVMKRRGTESKLAAFKTCSEPFTGTMSKIQSGTQADIQALCAERKAEDKRINNYMSCIQGYYGLNRAVLADLTKNLLYYFDTCAMRYVK